MRYICMFVFVFLLCLPPVDAQESNPPSAMWEAEIQKMLAGDSKNPPVEKAVLFFGSSSLRLWHTLAQDFPFAPVVNRGFGGSQLADLVYYAEKIVIPYKPRMVFVYAGDNDVASGKPPQRILADYQTLVTRIHRHLPGTLLGFISIKPSPCRWQWEEQIKKANALVKDFSAQDPRLFYVDIFTPMLDGNGCPRRELFLADGLHLNAQGYALWTTLITPFLK